MTVKKEPMQMVRLLIEEIVLYDDKMEIFYNFTNTTSPDDGTRRAFSFYLNNYDYSITTQHYCLDQSIKTFSEKKTIQVGLNMSY